MRRSRPVREDDGFGLIEVMISMVLLSALALATFAVIDRSQQASAFTRSKSAAASIAHADLNRLRQLKFSIASGASYRSQSTQTGVDGVQYTVTSEAQWATDSGVETSCTTPTTAGNSQYLHIKSTVTWPAMNGAAPVVADSIMAPRGKEINRTSGSLMVKVQDRNAAPVPGATVVVSGQSLVTSVAGCVFFPAVNAGQWPVTVSKPGIPYNFMDSDGNSPGSTTASVVVGDVSTASVSFDIPARYTPISLVREDGTPAAWTSVSLATQSKTITYPTTATTTPASSFASGLVFPFAAGWATYAGKCSGNNPALYATNSGTAMPNSSIIANPGQTVSTARAYMRSIALTIADTTLTANQAIRYYVTPYDDATYTTMASCTEGIAGTSTIPSTAPRSVTIPLDLPYGLYSICAENTKAVGSGYKSWRFTSTTAPTNAFSVMPSMNNTVTLKTTAPANDAGSTASGALSGASPNNVDTCPLP